jgi:hypothetical protein
MGNDVTEQRGHKTQGEGGTFTASGASDPFAASREELIALWAIADAACTYMLFEHKRVTERRYRQQAAAALVDLGRALDVLKHYRPFDKDGATGAAPLGALRTLGFLEFLRSFYILLLSFSSDGRYKRAEGWLS